jgi:hypothetical protein
VDANGGGGGGLSGGPALLKPERASLSAPGGLGISHVRGESLGGSREALLNPGAVAAPAKGARYA